MSNIEILINQFHIHQDDLRIRDYTERAGVSREKMRRRKKKPHTNIRMHKSDDHHDLKSIC